MIKKYIVFDRDGTIINYKPYLHNPKDIKLMPGIKELLNNFLLHSNKLFLHTNQSGISRGFFSKKDVINCNTKMINLLGFDNNIFERICIASELNISKHSYRKPSPLFGNEIIKKFKIEKTDLFYIGDNLSDLETASKIGCQAFGVENPKLNQDISNNQYGFKTFKNLMELNKFLYG